MLRPTTNRSTLRANLQTPWRGPRNGTIWAPAVLLRVGTFAGSHGPTHYSAEVLRRTAEQWNRVPVTVGHPIDSVGPISVQHAPNYIVGHLEHVHFDGQALRGEVVVTDQRFKGPAQAISEVSTGLFVENDDAGNAISIEPDHLALLPHEKGACSWEDGCGVRANEAPLRNLVAESLRGHVNAMGVNIMSDRRYEHEPVLYPPDVQHDEPTTLSEGEIESIEESADLLLPVGIKANARDEARRRAAQRGEPEPARASGGDDDAEPERPLMPTSFH